MERRHLEVFLAIVEHGGFTKAAEALHQAQPSLSQTIRALERELGCELFARRPRGAVLTPAGRALVEPARQVLRGFGLATGSVRAVLGLEGGRLDVVAAAGLAPDVVAPLVGRLRRHHPGIECAITEQRDEAHLVDLLTESACELGFLYLPEQSARALDAAGIETVPLGCQQLWLVAPPGTELPPGAVPVQELRELSFVGAARRGPVYDLLLAEARRAGLEVRPAVTAGTRAAILPLVLAGAGCTLMSGEPARTAAERGAVTRPLSPAVTLAYAVAYRTGPLSPAARKLLDYATEAAAQAPR